ncbi:hypothetical protein IQ255_26665 [Pleurocapsales cyanobacterium LEGE 10410]|nr:hypothetical protein [Pleurocapsales cyanobacterium LEGE 10410]
MNTDAIALAKKIKLYLENYQRQEQFSHIAKLITYALEVIPSEYNRQIFGYIPNIFREVELLPTDNEIQPKLFVGEPVIYKIYYPARQKLYGIPYVYIFCYLKENSRQLNIYFQSAHPKYKDLSPEHYHLNQEKISFEGCISAFNPDNISVISVSDPGHFTPGFTSSYYVGSAQFNFTKLIAECLENICSLSHISPSNTLLFGSSAGTFGALLSSTYFKQKTNVLAVNSQIFLQHRKQLMESFFGISHPQELLKHFGAQISFVRRFKQKLNSVPNIYILANVNDNLYQRNFEFYQQYITRFTQKGIDNQSVFDSYYGVDGHGRPEPSSLKAKIRIAREVLTMKSTVE